MSVRKKIADEIVSQFYDLIGEPELRSNTALNIADAILAIEVREEKRTCAKFCFKCSPWDDCWKTCAGTGRITRPVTLGELVGEK